MAGTLIDSEELHHFVEVESKTFALKVAENDLEQIQARKLGCRQGFSAPVEVFCLFLKKLERCFFSCSLVHSKPKEPQYQIVVHRLLLAEPLFGARSIVTCKETFHRDLWEEGVEDFEGEYVAYALMDHTHFCLQEPLAE